jgi:glycine hydroxymethyltransferase
LIDLRNKGISGKEADAALIQAHITVNKNMVPFDDKSPMVTSGIRIGTPAITTRGLVESDMETVASLIDESLMNASQPGVLQGVSKKVTEFMMERPLFAGNETFVHA